METKKRSFIKSITWRITVIITESIILFSITKEPFTTATFVGIKNGIVFVLYYLHERVWDKSDYGRG
ncbi:DUF2061 domain-containing protein [candidate division WWE3 bacterium]|uniref:DUF2061 domain-containing protein n=1 Tax=candidate division WWE3 bacterium TaxID=2053526 RepID=A0A955LHI4_UNCKA|nr:DUF2061 domain-containing protein [candidate division WWE3 bacterium]